MVEWLNANQGATMAVLTMVYVIATIALAWIGVNSNRTARRNIELAFELERTRTRPYVDFDIVLEDHIAWATLANRGMSPALNVLVSVTPVLERKFSSQRRECAFTKHRVALLVPGRTMRDLQDSSPSFMEQYPDPKFTGQVEYFAVNGERFVDTFTIDLSVHKSTLSTSKKDIGAEIEKLTRAVEALARKH